MIEKFEKEGLYYKAINLQEQEFKFKLFNSPDVTYQYPQYVFVLERIINPETDPEEVEVREVLFAFAKLPNQFRTGDLYRIICDIYDKLIDNYRDWVYNETEETEEESNSNETPTQSDETPTQSDAGN